MTVTWQTLISVAAIIAAAIALWGYFAKVVRWMDKQTAQDKNIAELRKHHDEDMRDIKTEQTLIVYGLLACLKGLAEQGCDGPVHEAIEKIEKHLNVEAHK